MIFSVNKLLVVFPPSVVCQWYVASVSPARQHSHHNHTSHINPPSPSSRPLALQTQNVNNWQVPYVNLYYINSFLIPNLRIPALKSNCTISTFRRLTNVLLNSTCNGPLCSLLDLERPVPDPELNSEEDLFYETFPNSASFMQFEALKVEK